MEEIANLTIDWNRSILIDAPIDENLILRLTPEILKLRQENSLPITVGINSPGGSLSALDILLGLLKGPNQDGARAPVITVSTHRAYSAAANFLAFGDYAVALPHSRILYHDVRFGDMEDVTPEKARDAAKSLQEANDRFALKLAHRVIRRLIWIYLDLRVQFPDSIQKYPEVFKNHSNILSSYAPSGDGYEGLNMAGFATCLWANLSAQNDILIKNVINRLSRWIVFSSLTKLIPSYKLPGSKRPGLLDGSKQLYKMFKGDQKHFDSCEDDLKLFLGLIINDFSEYKSERIVFNSVLERVTREYLILNSMNSPSHIKRASKLLLEHAHVFFDTELATGLESLPEEQKSSLLAKAEPHARLIWHFCVLLCRELFEGEHVLTPRDAQLLGLVDEVAGGGPVQSRREFRISMNKSEDIHQSTEPG